MKALVMEVQNIEEKSSWGDLPRDLLGVIVDELDLVDRYHLALVCKRFLSIIRTAPRQEGLSLGSSCLLIIGNGSKTCSLTNPLFNEKYNLNTPSLPFKVEILSCKDGWLLMLSHVDQKSVFFFNPLTKATIDLPNIDFPSFCVFSFTSPPTSHDCLVVAINAQGKFGVHVHTCHRGDDRWIGKEFECENEFYMRYTTPLFHNGRFYCLGNEGDLAIFDPVNESTCVVMESPGQDKLKSHRIHLLEHEGELYRVWVTKNGEFVQVRKLDPLTNQWNIVTDNIGDRHFYVSAIASICSSTSSSNHGRIYFSMLRDEGIIFYSYQTGSLQPMKNFYGAKDYPCSCWIKPRWITPSPEELQWSKLQ